MADDDDDQGTVGPDEIFAPTAPRRSNFTPPVNDAATLEAAANLFNDDALAAALAAELAKVASGPIPIIRPEAVVHLQPDTPAQTPPPAPVPAPVQEAPREAPPAPSEPVSVHWYPVPEPIAPAEPLQPTDALNFRNSFDSAAFESGPVESAPAAPPVSQPHSAFDPSTVWSLDGESAPPAAAPPLAPVVATQPEPVIQPVWEPQPIAEAAPPVAEAAAPLSDPAPAPAFTWTPASEFVPTSIPPAPAYVPERQADSPADEQVPPPWPPAPETSAPATDPPPYLGAPAPTVPPADAPPPPGYEMPVAPVVSEDIPAEQQQAGADTATSELRSRRQFHADDDLLQSPRDDGAGSDGTLSAIDQLQAQLDAQTRESREHAAWEQSMIALGTPEALAALERSRSGFRARAPQPVQSVPPAPDPPVVHESQTEEPQAAEPPAAPSAADEPSLEGTAFARFATPANDLYAGFTVPSDPEKLQFGPPPSSAPYDLTPPPDADQPFSGLQPPVDAAPPAPVASVPESPVFIQPPALVEPPTPLAPPSGDFDSLLEVGEQEDKPDAQPSTWLAPAPNPFTAPPIDAATGERRPFGEGVERDNAIDPSDSIFGSILGANAPVNAATTGGTTAGVAVVGEPILRQSQPILIPRAEPLPSEPQSAQVLTRQRVFTPELAGEEPTPLDYRVGRAARLFWLWFASNSSVVAVVFGGMIFALGMSLRQAVVATLAGIAVSFLPLGLGTLAGKRSGQPTMVVSRATFGVVGNVVPGVIGLLSRLFWAAALLWVFGAGLASILVRAKLTDGFSESELTMILMVLGFILSVVIAYFGYSLIARVQLVVSIVSGLLVVGFIALTLPSVNVKAALTIGDGNWTLAITGAVLVFSFVGLVWANSSADLARYQRVGSSGASSMLWATFGTALPSFVLIAYGALLASSSPRISAGLVAHPLDTLARLLPAWYPAPLLCAVGLSLISGTVIAMYSGGFAVQSVGIRVRRTGSTVIVGVLVLAIAIVLTVSITDFTELFRDFATSVAVPVAAWAGMFAVEIMIRNRRFDAVSLLKRGGVYADVRWANLVALVVISVLGLGFTSATVSWLSWEGFLFSPFGVALNSQLASSDVGVFVALVLGVIFPIIAGVPAIRKQERAERPAE